MSPCIHKLYAYSIWSKGSQYFFVSELITLDHLKFLTITLWHA